MSDVKKVNLGTELTDEELMEMTGGSTFRIECQKQYTYIPSVPTLKYGIIVAKYGVQPLYGIRPEIMPLYGIKPVE